MTEITVSSDFAERGLHVSLGCLRCRISPQAPAGGLDTALEEAVAAARRRIAQEPIAEWLAIAGTRRAYRALGKDPARYRPSAEALLRRVKQDRDLYRINPVVDVTNLISIRTGYSIGCYDLDRVEGPITFRRAGAGETYRGIGRGDLNLEGLPVFADRRGPFGSPTSDSERTSIAGDTREVLMVLVGFDDTQELREAMGHAAGSLEMYAGADRVAVRLVNGGG